MTSQSATGRRAVFSPSCQRSSNCAEAATDGAVSSCPLRVQAVLKRGFGWKGSIDTARSRMSDLLTLPMHLVMTIPYKVFSASLAFYIAICIARKSGYAEWRLAGRNPSLHPIFSPVAFVCIYPSILAAHVAINHPGLD